MKDAKQTVAASCLSLGSKTPLMAFLSCFLLEDHPPQGQKDGHTLAAGHLVFLVLQVSDRPQPFWISAVPKVSLQALGCLRIQLCLGHHLPCIPFVGPSTTHADPWPDPQGSPQRAAPSPQAAEPRVSQSTQMCLQPP